jgi:hypothetical protein
MGGVMNYLGDGVKQVVNTGGKDVTGKNIGSMLEKQNNISTSSPSTTFPSTTSSPSTTSQSYVTTPAPTGSSLNYNNYSTRANSTASSTPKSAYPSTPTISSASNNNYSDNVNTVNKFNDLYGQGKAPSVLYKQVEKKVKYEQPVRKGIPSPSGPWFNGMKGEHGNAPGALGGPKMDPYSYFGNIPSKGWEKEPEPSTYDFSKFT